MDSARVDAADAILDLGNVAVCKTTPALNAARDGEMKMSYRSNSADIGPIEARNAVKQNDCRAPLVEELEEWQMHMMITVLACASGLTSLDEEEICIMLNNGYSCTSGKLHIHFLRTII